MRRSQASSQIECFVSLGWSRKHFFPLINWFSVRAALPGPIV